MKYCAHIVKMLLLLFACFLPVASSWGFEVDAHGMISQRAATLFAEHYPEQSTKLASFIQAFIKGSKTEDDINITLQRAFNWHFADPGSRLGRTWWGAYRANTHRFADLIDQLAAADKGDKEAVFEIAGRLAHHIQDMRSPPHAVPIFHTSGEKFDEYGKEKTLSYALDTEQIRTVMSQPLRIDFASLDALRQEAAIDTKQQVDSPVVFQGNVIAPNWWEFWMGFEQVGSACGKEPVEGFGCFGKSVYGIETGVFTPEVFTWFHEQQIRKAIADTLWLLVALGR
ncbi:MAG: hypothetical protein OEL83_03550 [Desulforhopalus sp.]|nr:hypothetical protein [Desulforhopalus sp.]